MITHHVKWGLSALEFILHNSSELPSELRDALMSALHGVDTAHKIAARTTTYAGYR